MSSNSPTVLPYGRQSIDEADIAAVAEVLRGDWLTTGPAVDEFEAAFAEVTGAAHAIACANGTAALHLAALTLGLKPGEKAIVPAMTFAATANAVRYCGGEVIIADVDPDTGLMTAETLEQAAASVDGDIRAVFPVHLNGQCIDMDGIADFARDRGWTMIVDSCHAIGGTWTGTDGVSHPVGDSKVEAMSTFSLHPVKTITMGEGGVVTTSDAKHAQHLRRLRNHGIEREAGNFVQPDEAFDVSGDLNPWYYELAELGFNYRASDIQCALGHSQLKKLPGFIDRRREIVARYDAALPALAPKITPLARTPDNLPAWHLYVALIDFAGAETSRGAVMRELREAGIGSQVHYLPLHRQPYYRARYGDLALPGADAYYARCLSLPLFPAMADSDVDRVVDALASALRIN